MKIDAKHENVSKNRKNKKK